MLQTINTRRSVRKYTEANILEKDILEILEAAMNAPSAGNEQAWQFVVITDNVLKNQIGDFCPNAPYTKQAPVVILVCGDPEAQKYEGFYPQDCCAATENLLLAIHAKGLGGVWCAVHDNEIAMLQNLLNLPEKIIPFAIVPFGVPEKMPVYQSRFNKAKIHYNDKY